MDKPNPLAGFGGVGCGVWMAGKAPTSTGVSTISGIGPECKQQKKQGEKSGWSGGGRVEFLPGLRAAKKRRSTSRESRSSFKEKGDKSCFTVFVLKQQACQYVCFFVFWLFCLYYRLLGSDEGMAKNEAVVQKIKLFFEEKRVAVLFVLSFQAVVLVQVFFVPVQKTICLRQGWENCVGWQIKRRAYP